MNFFTRGNRRMSCLWKVAISVLAAGAWMFGPSIADAGKGGGHGGSHHGGGHHSGGHAQKHNRTKREGTKRHHVEVHAAKKHRLATRHENSGHSSHGAASHNSRGGAHHAAGESSRASSRGSSRTSAGSSSGASRKAASHVSNETSHHGSGDRRRDGWRRGYWGAHCWGPHYWGRHYWGAAYWGDADYAGGTADVEPASISSNGTVNDNSRRYIPDAAALMRGGRKAVADMLLGTWRVEKTNGYRGTWTFTPDGKVTNSDRHPRTTHWTIESGAVMIRWNGKLWESLTLPLDPTGSTGPCWQGTATAVKVQ